jgi:hypothetical protein
MTFVSSIFGENLLFNMTMTKYPEFRPSDQMIELHMDGRFVDSVTHQSIDVVNQIWQPRVPKVPQKEQFFIHESTVNSLLAVMTSKNNFMLKNQTLSNNIIDALPALKAHFGEDAFCEIALTPKNIKSGDAIHLESTRGIVYGVSESTNIQIYCNSTI